MIENYRTITNLLRYLELRINELYEQADNLGPRAKTKSNQYDLAISELEFIKDWLNEIEAINEF